MAYTRHHGKRVSKPHATLLKAYERKHNVTLYINQGARTIAEQAKFYWDYLHNGGPLAAKPWGGAPHIKWKLAHHALDINDGISDRVAAFYRAHDIPVAFNVPGEPWHMDTLDRGALKRAAKRINENQTPRTLKPGDSGAAVKKLKRTLKRRWNMQGFNNTRFYNKKTVDAVKRFQGRHNLKEDGIVGPNTWKRILR